MFYGPVVQLVRTPACHAGGREFEPHPDRHLAAVYIQRLLLCYFLIIIIYIAVKQRMEECYEIAEFCRIGKIYSK